MELITIVKENLKTKARDFVILFSSDLDLDYEKLIDYYNVSFASLKLFGIDFWKYFIICHTENFDQSPCFLIKST